MKKETVLNLDSSAVHVRLGMCAAALLGTAAAVPEADAAIITFSVPVPVPQTLQGVYVNFGTGATAGAPFTGWDFNPYQAASTNLSFYWAATPAGNYGGVAATTTGPYLSLSPGTVVGPGSTYSISLTPAATTGSPYLTAGTHILGFRFFNEASSAVNYGYLTMSNGGTTGFPATILSWSFDNTGAPITVVPEPATATLLTLAALALGALGLREWRRQRTA